VLSRLARLIGEDDNDIGLEAMSKDKSDPFLALGVTDSISQLMQDLKGSPIQKLFNELNNSPASEFQKLFNSPSVRMASDLLKSPSMNLATTIAGADSTWLLASKQLDAIKASHPIVDGSAFEVMNQLRGSSAFSTMAGNISALDMGTIHSLSKTLADFSRTNKWASVIASSDSINIAKLVQTSLPELNEFKRITNAATGIMNALSVADRVRLSATFSLPTGLEITKIKLSTFAGAADILGFQAKTSFAAYEQLFGHWHTRPNLPLAFWQDPEVRRRRYREAEVDPGLIEIDTAAAIEVVIESGIAAGGFDGKALVVQLDIAGLSMQIRSSSAGTDVFRAINSFEQMLRRCISDKLESVAGPRWFKQRVDGTLVKKARVNRATAMSNGEQDKALIAYLDLGELMATILRNDNWSGVFSNIFPNRERFGFDMQALIASRRPTMHAREIDAVRLVETICIIRRLANWIESDGEWKKIAESED
jgi:hypothetical protein